MSADLYAVVRRPSGPSQTVAYTATAGVISDALPRGINSVLVLCTTHAYVKVGVSPTATATDLPVAAGVPTIIPIEQPSVTGQQGLIKVSALQLASGGSLIAQGLAD